MLMRMNGQVFMTEIPIYGVLELELSPEIKLVYYKGMGVVVYITEGLPESIITDVMTRYSDVVEAFLAEARRLYRDDLP